MTALCWIETQQGSFRFVHPIDSRTCTMATVRNPPYGTCMELDGTVSAKIAPRLKCYKNASRLNCYNFPTNNAIDFLSSTLHSEMVSYEVLKTGSR